MATIIRDRVLEAGTVTGTGNITLTGAPAGYERFADIPDLQIGDSFPVGIWEVDADGTPNGDYENGIYTYVSADTLERTDVRQSSNGDALVSFAAGSKYVALTFLSSDKQRAGNVFAQYMNFYLP